MRKRIAAHWWLYPASVTPLAVAYLFGPGFLNSGPVFNVIGLSASVAIVVGVRRHRPAAAWPWYLLALGQALFVTGDVLAYNYKSFFGGEIPFPSIADPVYLAVYPLTVAALLMMIRRRNPGRDWASLVDSLILTIGLALLSWVFLIAPYAHNGTLGVDAKLVSMAYPLMDILVLGVAMRMAVGAGQRNTSFYLLIAGIGALLVSDSIYYWVELHTIYQGGGLLDGGWIVYYVLLGSAALHPSMTKVSQAAAPSSRLTRTRIIQIGAAALIAPAIEMASASPAPRVDALVIGGAAAILFGLVVVRMTLLARAQAAAADRERTMRQAQGSLVTATSEQEILSATHDAATTLAGAATLPQILWTAEVGGRRCLIGEQVGGRGYELTVPMASLPGELVDQLVHRRPVDFANARAGLGPGAPLTPAVVWPFLVQGQIAGVIALLDSSGVPYSLRDSLEALAGQVGLALESATLTEHVLRNQSEKRFTALVKHSSDAIFVLEADTTVQYASPSVTRLLDRNASELIGRPLGEHMDEEDRLHMTAAMSRLRAQIMDTSELLELRIRHRDGRWVDTESLMTDLLDNQSVGGIVVNVRDVTERKQFEEQLAYQAFHDSVTQLANRALFSDRVEHALRRRSEAGSSIAVLFLDLDNFKSINDTLGHAAGDRLLRTIAARLESTLRVGDTVARLGGDEFGILLDDVEGGRSQRSRTGCWMSSRSRPRWTTTTSVSNAASAWPFHTRALSSSARSSTCCVTQTSRCTQPRRPAVTPTVTSKPRCTSAPSLSGNCATS